MHKPSYISSIRPDESADEHSDWTPPKTRHMGAQKDKARKYAYSEQDTADWLLDSRKPTVSKRDDKNRKSEYDCTSSWPLPSTSDVSESPGGEEIGRGKVTLDGHGMSAALQTSIFSDVEHARLGDEPELSAIGLGERRECNISIASLESHGAALTRDIHQHMAKLLTAVSSVPAGAGVDGRKPPPMSAVDAGAGPPRQEDAPTKTSATHPTSTSGAVLSSVQQTLTLARAEARRLSGEQHEDKLSAQLEEERCRRQHCEKTIHELQGRILGLEENLAITESPLKKKTKTVSQLNETLEQVMGGWKQLEANTEAELRAVREERAAAADSVKNQQDLIDRLRSEVARERRSGDRKQAELEKTVRDHCRLTQHLVEAMRGFALTVGHKDFPHRDTVVAGDDLVNLVRNLQDAARSLLTSKEAGAQELRTQVASVRAELEAARDSVKKEKETKELLEYRYKERLDNADKVLKLTKDSLTAKLTDAEAKLAEARSAAESEKQSAVEAAKALQVARAKIESLNVTIGVKESKHRRETEETVHHLTERWEAKVAKAFENHEEAERGLKSKVEELRAELATMARRNAELQEANRRAATKIQGLFTDQCSEVLQLLTGPQPQHVHQLGKRDVYSTYPVFSAGGYRYVASPYKEPMDHPYKEPVKIAEDFQKTYPYHKRKDVEEGATTRDENLQSPDSECTSLLTDSSFRIPEDTLDEDMEKKKRQQLTKKQRGEELQHYIKLLMPEPHMNEYDLDKEPSKDVKATPEKAKKSYGDRKFNSPKQSRKLHQKPVWKPISR